MKELLDLLARMRAARAAWLDYDMPGPMAEQAVYDAALHECGRLERAYMDAMCEFAALTAALLDNGTLTVTSAPAHLRPWVREMRLTGAGP